MSMEGVDLDINNYSLEDLLSLFDLDMSWTVNDLKRAKHSALMTHPDKSRLPSRYFEFFMRAYSELEALTNFRDRSSTKEVSRGEDTVDSGVLRQVEQMTKEGTFSKAFNEMFMEHGSSLTEMDRGHGYADWLASTSAESNESIDDRRSRLRSSQDLTKLPVDSMSSCQASMIDSAEGTASFQSSLFSKLGYDDLRQAHEMTVVPVNPADTGNARPRSVFELQQIRSAVPNPRTRAESEAILRSEAGRSGAEGAHRAYRLRRQTEQGGMASSHMRSKFLLLRR